MSDATRPAVTSLSPSRSLVPANENDTAKEFQAVIIEFSVGDLAHAAKRSKDAAKAWKAGRSLPSAWSLFNMAQEIKPVRNWMMAKLNVREAPEFLTDQVMGAMIGALHQVSQQSGPDGDAVRRILSGAPE